jgi:hypothetical protein
MGLLTDIARFGILPLALTLFAAQVAARELGYWLGRRSARSDQPVESVGVVVTSMLGLLAFVLGLTLAHANTRFQERRLDALAEAQAIGTAWLRAQTVGEQAGAEIGRLLEAYARLRLDFVRHDGTSAGLDAINARTDALQAEIWGHAAGLARRRADPVVNTLLASLTETFDLTLAQRYAFLSGTNQPLVGLLLGMAVISMAALGYQFGLRGRPVRLLTLVLLLLWTTVLVTIIDLGAARLGAIRTDASPYLWTIESFGKPPVAR